MTSYKNPGSTGVDAKKARLDADKTAKPLTKLVGHAKVGDCIGPGVTVADQWRHEDGPSIALATPPDPGMTLNERFRAAQAAYDAADKALEAHYRTLVKAALAQGNITHAKALAMQCCPSSVTAVFLYDNIRQATGGKDFIGVYLRGDKGVVFAEGDLRELPPMEGVLDAIRVHELDNENISAVVKSGDIHDLIRSHEKLRMLLLSRFRESEPE